MMDTMAYANPDFDKRQGNNRVSFLEVILPQMENIRVRGLIATIIIEDSYAQTCRNFGFKLPVDNNAVDRYLKEHNLEDKFDEECFSIIKKRLETPIARLIFLEKSIPSEHTPYQFDIYQNDPSNC